MFSPWCFMCGRLQAARPLIGVRTHPGLQVWVPRLLIWVHTDLGFRCLLGLLIQCSQSRDLREWGRKRPRLLQ